MTPEKFHPRLLLTESGCREYQGMRKYGYGQVRVNNHRIQAHRYAWIIANGPIPPGLFVLHHCDNRPCCELSHLFLGTQQDNIDDAQQKGRLARGIDQLNHVNAQKTHCKRGHPFDRENTFWDSNQTGRPRRQCRACGAMRARLKRAAKRDS